MIKWTTPTLLCKIPKDIAFDYLILTLKSRSYKINKTVPFSEIEDGTFSITLSQEETSKFEIGTNVEAQVNIISDGDLLTRLGSNIICLHVCRNLYDEEIQNGE